MRTRVVLSLLVLTGPSAWALTPADIDAAAARASYGERTVVRRLASDRYAGRDNDTPESGVAQTYLIRRLKRLGPGLDATQLGEAAYRQPFVQSGQTGTNLLAVIPGSELPGEYVIVGAHYDHLDTRSAGSGHCSARGTPGGEVCNGATDNATGVAAVLAIGRSIRRLPTPPRRSVVLALWDSEEDGLLGSLYYVNHPVVPLAQTVGYINFDIQGANLLPSLHGTSFAISAETGGTAFQDLVTEAIGVEGLGTRMLSYIFGQLRSDYANFVAHQVPTVFFSDATGGCYHTTGDDVRIVDFGKLRAQTRIAFRLAVALAEAATPPAFLPTNPTLATYEDAVVLSQVVDTGLADLALFSDADQAVIQGVATELAGIVSDGPALFDGVDVGTLLGDAVKVLDALGHLGCRRM
jgi:hypothetical protein